MCILIQPKYAVSEVIGYLKGKSAIAVARQFGESRATALAIPYMKAFLLCQGMWDMSQFLSEWFISKSGKILKRTGTFKRQRGWEIKSPGNF